MAFYPTSPARPSSTGRLSGPRSSITAQKFTDTEHEQLIRLPLRRPSPLTRRDPTRPRRPDWAEVRGGAAPGGAGQIQPKPPPAGTTATTGSAMLVEHTCRDAYGGD
ncbi:MAG: hypothetical protein U0401_20245 [Anaerolineae bacterium]